MEGGIKFDSLDVGYLKVKDSAERFVVVHFSVCPFRWEPSKDSFIVHPLASNPGWATMHVVWAPLVGTVPLIYHLSTSNSGPPLPE
ncbi:Poly(A)-specific ribonuclease PARN [Acorus calamus]|uniref:Poly(A)-specific ribonuclease PARN n=1 Tax=Acorus calamus TaxID=4465 RepID=A0AAV9F5G8_ACOCL|nr:Poly(A)-specific ribonuclease PARN [Acorus calamus]